MTGAVYDSSGRLVPQSQRLMFEGDGLRRVPADPARIGRPKAPHRLEGAWVFGGHWMMHFGHFLLETLPNLWPLDSRSADGIVAITHPERPMPAAEGAALTRAEPTEPQRELLDLAGLGGLDVMISRRRQVQVERLLVPERPVVIKHWVRPEAVALWRRISAAVGDRGTARKVLLSRSRFNAAEGRASTGPLRSDPAWDSRLDRAFSAAGFEIVHPEELTIREQIEIVRGAEVIAGSAGSALHLACFAEPGTKVLEIGDDRSEGTERQANQMAIDAACGHYVDVVAYGDVDGLDNLERLVDHGFVRRASLSVRHVLGRARTGLSAHQRLRSE